MHFLTALLGSLRAARHWLSDQARDSLDRMCTALPSGREKQAVDKRLAHYASRLSERTNWQISRQLLELRLVADEHILDYRRCIGQARLVIALAPDAAPSERTVEALRRATGTATATIRETHRTLTAECKAWQTIATRIRRARHPLFATQVFFRLSDRSGLEVASLVVGALIAIGAVQMLFFYRAAANQSVHQYWTWDDLVIQAINIVPAAVLTVLAVEIAFKLYRRIAERLGRVRLILAVLRHPLWFAAVVFLLPMMGTASYWGYFRGSEVFSAFAESGGNQLATVMDGSILRDVHLVGTTSRAAVFLQAKDNGSPDDRHQALSEFGSPRPTYRTVAAAVVCDFPTARRWLPGFLCTMSAGNGSTQSAGNAASPSGAGTSDPNKRPAPYRVFAMDRALVVCHAYGDACLSFPKRSPLDDVRGDLRVLSDRAARATAQQQSRQLSSQRTLNRRFDALDEHLNRHLARVLRAVTPPPKDDSGTE